MNRKVLILLLIVLITMVFMLTGCGDSKEDLLEEAENATVDDINSTSMENIASAKQKYCNKTLLLEGQVYDIAEDHVELKRLNGGLSDGCYFVDVYLSTDDIAQLKKDQDITVVGKTTDKITESSITTAGFTLVFNHYQMTKAYLVSN